MVETDYFDKYENVSVAIFPIGCELVKEEKGRREAVKGASDFLHIQNQYFKKGFGVNHPCYNCSFNSAGCNAATIEYHDKEKRFLIQPKTADFTVLASFNP